MKYGFILLILCTLSSGNETQDIVPPEEGDPDLGQQPLPFGATDYYRLNTNSRAPYSFYGVTNTGNPFSIGTPPQPIITNPGVNNPRFPVFPTAIGTRVNPVVPTTTIVQYPRLPTTNRFPVTNVNQYPGLPSTNTNQYPGLPTTNTNQYPTTNTNQYPGLPTINTNQYPGLPTTDTNQYPGFPTTNTNQYPITNTNQYPGLPTINTNQYPGLPSTNANQYPGLPTTNTNQYLGPTLTNSNQYPELPSINVNENSNTNQFPSTRVQPTTSVNNNQGFPATPTSIRQYFPPYTLDNNGLPAFINSNRFPDYDPNNFNRNTVNPPYTNTQRFSTTSTSASPRVNPTFPTTNRFLPNTQVFPNTQVNPNVNTNTMFPLTSTTNTQYPSTNTQLYPNQPNTVYPSTRSAGSLVTKMDTATGLPYREDPNTGVWTFLDGNGFPFPVKEGGESVYGVSSYIEPGDGRKIYITGMGKPVTITNGNTNNPVNANTSPSDSSQVPWPFE